MRFCTPSTQCRTIVHADDFGISKAQSERILNCVCSNAKTAPFSKASNASTATTAATTAATTTTAADTADTTVTTGTADTTVTRDTGDMSTLAKGALNSLSAMVTSPHFHECAKLLKPLGNELSVGLHVNLVEGKCAADPLSIPLLVNDKGIFKRSFGGLLILSTTRAHTARTQLTREITAQIEQFLSEFPEMKDHLRIDSHQHCHMIPAVFDALVRSVEESNCTVEYLRIPAEPILPFIWSKSVHLVPLVNWVKNAVLNALWLTNKHKLPNIMQHTAVFCGICFSGRMTKENVRRVAHHFKRYAAAKHMSVEFLFHPGGISSISECLNPNLADFANFYLSPNRNAEANAVKDLAL